MPITTNAATGALPVREQEHRLPSGGVLYPDWDDGTVIIKPYSFSTEATLTSNLKWEEKFDKILNAVTELPKGMTPENLLIGDAFFIFACARALTYGEVYNFQSRCDMCGHIESHSMRVPDELPVHCWFTKETLDQSQIDKGNPNAKESVLLRGGSFMTSSFFEVELPYLRDVVTLKFLTLKDERELTARFEEIRRVTGAKDTSEAQEVARIAQHIAEVNGTVADNILEMEEHVRENIKGEDMVALYDAIQAKSCGINFVGEVVCESCKGVYPNAIPLRSEFFQRGRG